MRARWITFPGRCQNGASRNRTFPAPEFRRYFVPEHRIEHPVIQICGLGFFEWRFNGKSYTSDMLVPSPSQYDLRWRYLTYQLPVVLEPGEMCVFSVIVGNGLYNCQTEEIWNFANASWRDFPKMIFTLFDDGIPVMVSDEEWIVSRSAVIFDSFRGGESYDARREEPFSMTEPPSESIPLQLKGWSFWNRPDEPAGHWYKVWIAAPPGGIGEEQNFPGCRIIDRHAMREISPGIWQAPVNCSGVPCLHVRGEAGSSVKMICGERLTSDGSDLDLHDIGQLVKPGGHFQEDCYILKGSGTESWHPHFTFHGFQYVKVICEGDVEILALEQLEIHTGFEEHGSINTSDERLMKLEELCHRGAVSNFCGFPTDCPHREKNGWTSEAMLQCQYLLYRYDAAHAYGAFADMIGDTQRISGQISCIAPAPGWGYNWGSRGHWDYALYDIPYSLWLFTGDKSYLTAHFPQMLRNLDFQDMVEQHGMINGLEDWLPPEGSEPDCFSASAFRIGMLKRAAEIADVLGETKESTALRQRQKEAVEKFNARYYLGEGRYQGEHSTVPATVLNLNIVPDADRALCARRLREIVLKNQYKVDYGTIGSRMVPRALFENGFTDEAFELMTQPEYPGYTFLSETLHLTALPEQWSAERDSLLHGAFSDIAGCMFRYLAGFCHSAEKPGKHFLEIRPQLPQKLHDFSAQYIGFQSSWHREKEKIFFHFSVPADAEAVIFLPDGERKQLSSGNTELQINIEKK